MKYVFMVLSPKLLINHTQKSNVLQPDLLEAHSKAVHCRGQGQGSSRPRPAVFKAKATNFCPIGVLEVDASPRGPHSWNVGYDPTIK